MLIFATLSLISGLWNQVSLEGKDAELPNLGDDPVMSQLMYSKQVNALRILTLMLPKLHRSLLKKLLALLHRVTDRVAQNRMSPLALGTVFGPVFVPTVFPESRSVASACSRNRVNLEHSTLKNVIFSFIESRLPL